VVNRREARRKTLQRTRERRREKGKTRMAHTRKVKEQRQQTNALEKGVSSEGGEGIERVVTQQIEGTDV
jgi:hypothetical protein